MSKTRTHWTLDDNVIALIADSTTPGKRGHLVSEIVKAYGEIMGAIEPTDNSIGIQEQIVERLARIELQLVVLNKQLRGERMPTLRATGND